MVFSNREQNIDRETYQLISKQIAFYIKKTGQNLITIDELVEGILNDRTIKTNLNLSWLILQVKNEMVSQSLLFVSFPKPLCQQIGLTLKGKRNFGE